MLVITFFIRLAPILRIYVPYTKVIMSLALDLFYVAILSTMMNIFVCREATGDELLQTFMEFDCYTSCWQGTHLIYAIIGLVLVLIFVVFGAIERPKWQSLDGSEQSVLLTPNFITLKSFVMTFIIVIKKVTIHDMKILYVCFFTVISACYLGIIIHQKPYNLRVLNLWYILSVAALC